MGLHFGGLQKYSLIDYPGAVSCVLFTSGCNFRCPYCHNPGLVSRARYRPRALTESKILDFLNARKRILDGVVLSGGEPTLQPDLGSFCRKVKQLGYKVKLDTNGSRPDVLKRLIRDGDIDYVAMDIKSTPYSYAPFVMEDFSPRNIMASIQHIMSSVPAYEFRTTCVRPFVDMHIIENIAKAIEGAMLYALQPFHSATVLEPSFFRRNDLIHDGHELMDFKSMAEPWVQKCIVRK